MKLKVQPVNPGNFGLYGKVIKVPTAVSPTVTGVHLAYWKQQAVFNVHGPVEIGVLKLWKHAMRFQQMERHRDTPELLVALDGTFLIPVAPASDEAPEPGHVEVFEVAPGQAVLLECNCWHWAPCPVDKPEMTLLVIFKDNTSQMDMVIADLKEICEVE